MFFFEINTIFLSISVCVSIRRSEFIRTGEANLSSSSSTEEICGGAVEHPVDGDVL
jgi:hypothetical protein